VRGPLRSLRHDPGGVGAAGALGVSTATPMNAAIQGVCSHRSLSSSSSPWPSAFCPSRGPSRTSCPWLSCSSRSRCLLEIDEYFRVDASAGNSIKVWTVSQLTANYTVFWEQSGSPQVHVNSLRVSAFMGLVAAISRSRQIRGSSESRTYPGNTSRSLETWSTQGQTNLPAQKLRENEEARHVRPSGFLLAFLLHFGGHWRASFLSWGVLSAFGFFVSSFSFGCCPAHATRPALGGPSTDL